MSKRFRRGFADMRKNFWGIPVPRQTEQNRGRIERPRHWIPKDQRDKILQRALGNGELSCESSTSSGHQLKVSNGKPSSNKDESSNGSRAKIAVRFHGMDSRGQMITTTRIADNLTLTTHIKDSSFCHQEMSPLKKKGRLGNKQRGSQAGDDSHHKYNSVATSNFQEAQWNCSLDEVRSSGF